MAVPIDPSRSASAMPPLAQLLAEAALQRQSALLGVDPPRAAPPPTLPAGSPTPQAPAALPLPAAPRPTAADTAHISPQARQQLGAGFDPQRGAGNAGASSSAGRAAGPAGAPVGAAPQLPGKPPLDASAGLLGSAAQATSAAWPTANPGAALVGLVSQAVAQLTAGTSPQRVVAAQAWPVGLAEALESGALAEDMPPLQTWLVRQGTVQTPEGPRGVAVTLRVPVPWLASQAPAPAPAGEPPGMLQLPFTGSPQALRSGVFALVLQGGEPQAGRTSALLVVDFQTTAPAVVYGREMLHARLDPWTQIAVLQASGQVPREDERARHDASRLCDTVGCPYAARAACVQPFCLAMRAVSPLEPAGPQPRA